ncbi:hypothetical protein RNZ50_09870 [Paracoccaceae bacterium Fryx2]|nr:hypothetical protein [Paracoccaceae bacterium Fryx2]
MRRRFLILGLVLAAVLGLAWALGALDGIARWADAGKREVQDMLAAALRRLRAGDPGALMALLGVAFGYGFFHAAGPGHGKLLIGSYAMARRVRLGPLAAIALASSLAQATVAVALVYAGVFLLGWGRERLVAVTEQVMAPVSYAAIAGIGLWLAWRGWRGLRRGGHDHDHGHHDHGHHGHGHHGHGHHDHGHVHDASCGHAHGPSVEEVARVAGWRDALVLIAGIALRPCTGALFLLVLTWQMKIPAAGIAGAYAMGLGTATVTIAVAAASVWAREGALAALPGARLAAALPLLELGIGLLVALISGQLLLSSL